MLLLGLFLVIAAVVQGSKGSYVDIEYTINVPDKDVMTLRTDRSKPYYKILTRTNNGKIYIGGKEELLILDSASLQMFENVSIPTNESEGGLPCAILAGSEMEKICQNYIRLAEDINSTIIFVCGTNSYDPMCRFVNVDDGSYTLDMNIRIPAKERVQYSVEQNSTALFNQVNQRLFVGHNELSQPNPSHISKFSIDFEALVLDTVAQTDDQNENYINEPDFVGKPFSHEGFIYFFYRETAVEAVNQGKFVYSRVGRVCENDVTNQLSTFFKARLNCSLQGEFPFYFDHIQDVIVGEDNGEPIFYAVFTTTPHGPASSAVCSYRLADIITVFDNSKFKGKKATGKLPGPIDRPAFAIKYTGCATSFSAPEREFQRDNPLMDELVPNYNANDMKKRSHPPLFYSTQMNLYSIAYDSFKDIFYVGTEHGTILKAVRSEDGVTGWLVYQQEFSDVKHPITGLHYSNDTQSLLVVNEQGLYRVDVSSCRAYCMEECEKSYAGYCEVIGGRCVSERNSSISQELKVEDVRILSLNTKTIKSCHSRRVELTCELKGSRACGDINLSWNFTSEDGTDPERLVSCSGESKCIGENSTLAPFVQFQEISSHPHYKLVHLSVDVYKKHTVGNFICAGDIMNTTVTIEVDESPGCLTFKSYEERKGRRVKLEDENKALSDCNGNDMTSKISNNVLFQTCDQCPGDVRINNT